MQKNMQNNILKIYCSNKQASYTQIFNSEISIIKKFDTFTHICISLSEVK